MKSLNGDKILKFLKKNGATKRFAMDSKFSKWKNYRNMIDELENDGYVYITFLRAAEPALLDLLEDEYSISDKGMLRLENKKTTTFRFWVGIILGFFSGALLYDLVEFLKTLIGS